MKICFISPKSYPLFNPEVKATFGGAEVQMSTLAKACAHDVSLDVHVMVADFGQADQEQREGCHVWKALNFKNNPLRQILDFSKIFKQIDADVYIQRTLTLYSGIIARYTSRTMKKRFIYMVAHDMETDGTHPLYRKPFISWLAKNVFRHADCVVVQNEYEKAQLLRSHPGLVVVIFKKPIDEGIYRLQAKKKYDGIWVGRCDDWKKPEAFLSMCKALPENSFVMIAPPATGKQAYFEKIKSVAAGLPNVTFYDFLPNKEVRVQLAESRIFCMTSTQEGDWPMVVLEAAASGLPIVSLHVNYDGLIDECGGGIYCNNDTHTLAVSMERLCRDDDLYVSMSSGARTYIARYHAIDTQMEKFKELLHDTVKKGYA